MNKPLRILTLVLLLAACSHTPTQIPSSPIPNPIIQNTQTASPLPQDDTPTAGMPMTSTSAVAPEPTVNIPLQVFSPLDEAVINTSQIDVIGSAPAGAVVSVNDDIIVVGDDGQFKTTIFLDEGPNLVEVIASDLNGNESSLLLTVTYEP